MSADPTGGGLGPLLWALLLRSLVWAAVVAVVVAGIVWLVAGRRPAAAGRIRQLSFGAAGAAEPRARRFLRISFGVLWVLDGLLQAQPRMPAGFMDEVQSHAAGTGWLVDVLDPLARAWTRHPVAADAATVWVQVGLGLLFLLGGSGLLIRLASVAAIAWSGVVWVLGEGVGGLLHAGATWSSGAPGAVLPYAVAAALLLVPLRWWESGRAQLLARRSSAVLLAAGAVLQALPAEGAWTATGAAAPFAAGAEQRQPGIALWPITHLATAGATHPALVNAVTVALVAAAALAVWLSGRTAVLAPVLVLCAATWWLAQDFGVLGGMSTDPGTALPLGLLLVSALPGWSAGAAPARAAEPGTQPAPARLRLGAGAAVATLAVVLAVVLPLVMVAVLPGPADATAIAADSGGGLRTLPPRPLPDFALTDQRGAPVSTSSLRGKLVLVTFLDPVCDSDCPLIANQLAAADRQLGDLAGRVEIVALDTNPLFPRVEDVAAFTDSHGLTDLPNWHFICGPAASMQDLLAEFGVAVSVPTVGMIEHSEGIYFVTPDGLEAAYLDDGANAQLTTAYSQQIRDEIRSLL